MYIYDMRSFYSNETVKCSSSDSASSSGDVVHVFMSSFMLKTPRASRASVCMCAVNETARLSFINRDAEHAGFIFK